MARALAERLGIVMVNSGAMYRAVTWKILSEQIDPHDTPAVISSLKKMEILCSHDGTLSSITIDGTDPTPFIRKPEINANVSTISAIPEVRDKLVGLQRDYLENTHVVMEGRDIGSVVFPDTPFKIYIDADPSVRNNRRSGDGEIDSVAQRDADDSSRATAPLKVADGATKIDTSNLTIEGAIQAAIDTLRKARLPHAATNPFPGRNPWLDALDVLARLDVFRRSLPHHLRLTPRRNGEPNHLLPSPYSLQSPELPRPTTHRKSLQR